MRAMFLAYGPFAKGIYNKRVESLPDSYEGSNAVIAPFKNVEVYNLLSKLLGIEEWAAQNNGTKDFWDM